MVKYKRPNWRYHEVLTALGTADEIKWMMFGKGYEPPPEDTIQGWRNRNSIPGKWVPVIIELATDKGIINTLSDLKPEKPRGRKRLGKPAAMAS